MRNVMVCLIHLCTLIVSVKLCAGSSGEQSVNFLLIGDWGLPGFNQSLIADKMGKWATKEHLAFVVALGDNFYCKCQIIVLCFSPVIS
jgi:hypothetical protein